LDLSKLTDNNTLVISSFILQLPSTKQNAPFLVTVLLPQVNILYVNDQSWPGSSVGIATGYGLDGPRIESRWGRDFPQESRPTLGPTQPPVQWVPMGTGSFPGVKYGRSVLLTIHPLLVPQSWKSRAVPLLTLWATPGL